MSNPSNAEDPKGSLQNQKTDKDDVSQNKDANQSLIDKDLKEQIRRALECTGIKIP